MQRVLNDALTDALAAEVREQLHPTGKGGTLGAKEVSCESRERCTAKFEVRWKGGFLGSDYVSNLAWTLTEKDSSVRVESETSMISADQAHIDALGVRLAERVHLAPSGAPAASADAPVKAARAKSAASAPAAAPAAVPGSRIPAVEIEIAGRWLASWYDEGGLTKL